MSPAERIDEIRERIDEIRKMRAAVQRDFNHHNFDRQEEKNAAVYLADIGWLLGALQATAEAFSAQANYSLGFDWITYVVDGAP